MEKNGKRIEFKMSMISQERAVFLGEYSRPLDDKRRLTVPSKWRFSGDDSEKAYLALPNLSNGSITLYPPEMTEKIYEKVSQMGISNQEKQRVLVQLFRKGETLGCDKQGRITLSEKLMEHAGVTREIQLVGDFTNFQIWNPQRLDEWLAVGGSANVETILGELGL